VGLIPPEWDDAASRSRYVPISDAP
jgi:hypothetical protein